MPDRQRTVDIERRALAKTVEIPRSKILYALQTRIEISPDEIKRVARKFAISGEIEFFEPYVTLGGSIWYESSQVPSLMTPEERAKTNYALGELAKAQKESIGL